MPGIATKKKGLGHDVIENLFSKSPNALPFTKLPHGTDRKDRSEIISKLVNLKDCLASEDDKNICNTMIQRCFERKIDPNYVIPSHFNNKLLMELIAHGDEALASQCLVHYGNSRDNSFLTQKAEVAETNSPLTLAVKKGFYDIALQILDCLPPSVAKQQLNQYQNDPRAPFTPLHYMATLYGRKDLPKAKMLIERMVELGAEIDKQNGFGETAYDHLAYNPTPLNLWQEDQAKFKLQLYQVEVMFQGRLAMFLSDDLRSEITKYGIRLKGKNCPFARLKDDPVLQCIAKHFKDEISGGKEMQDRKSWFEAIEVFFNNQNLLSLSEREALSPEESALLKKMHHMMTAKTWNQHMEYTSGDPSIGCEPIDFLKKKGFKLTQEQEKSITEDFENSDRSEALKKLYIDHGWQCMLQKDFVKACKNVDGNCFAEYDEINPENGYALYSPRGIAIEAQTLKAIDTMSGLNAALCWYDNNSGLPESDFMNHLHKITYASRAEHPAEYYQLRHKLNPMMALSKEKLEEIYQQKHGSDAAMAATILALKHCQADEKEKAYSLMKDAIKNDLTTTLELSKEVAYGEIQQAAFICDILGAIGVDDMQSQIQKWKEIKVQAFQDIAHLALAHQKINEWEAILATNQTEYFGYSIAELLSTQKHPNAEIEEERQTFKAELTPVIDRTISLICKEYREHQGTPDQLPKMLDEKLDQLLKTPPSITQIEEVKQPFAPNITQGKN